MSCLCLCLLSEFRPKQISLDVCQRVGVLRERLGVKRRIVRVIIRQIALTSALLKTYFPKWGCFKTYCTWVLFWHVKHMQGANGGGAFRQAVTYGLGVASESGDLAFMLVSPSQMAILPCMMGGASQSGAFQRQSFQANRLFRWCRFAFSDARCFLGGIQVFTWHNKCIVVK